MGKRGPQPFKPTPKHRALVKLLMAGGIAEPVIAHRLGICQNTLRRWFEDELKFGRDTKRAENLERLDKAAEAGNVTAMKHLDGKFDLVSVKAEAGVTGSAGAKPGKKEIARAEAMNAGANSEWGDDLKPPDALPN